MINAKKSMDQLFVSRVRVKLLKFFLMNKDVPTHLRGVVRELKEEINAVRRELNRLEEIKLLKSESRGNRKYYMVNNEGPFLDELTGMIHKTFGLGGDILRNEAKLGEVNFAILTGSYLHNITSNTHGVDLVVIGKVNMEELDRIVGEFEKKENREVKYTVFSLGDFELRKKRRDNFVMELLINDKVMLVGTYMDLIS